MKKYYTQCHYLEDMTPFTFKVWMDYEEAVANAQHLLKICDLPHIDIIEHTTNKLFITLHKLKDVIPNKTNYIGKKQKCAV